MSDRHRPKAADVARVIAETCGPMRTVHVGADDEELLVALLTRGIDAFAVAAEGAHQCLESSPGRWLQGPVDRLDTGGFDTVIATGWLDRLVDHQGGGDTDGNSAVDAAVAARLADLHRLSQRFVVLVVAHRNRAWWESRCFQAGFRKHPAYFLVHPYESLNRDDGPLIVPLEKVPEPALARFPLAVLHAERLLHMDMLRETGRRSDAHCVRYFMASAFVRPGDTVLDLACGYGYGSHLLYQQSPADSVLGIDLSEAAIDYARANYGHEDRVRFEVGNAQDLRAVPDDSIDFIATFETIEHLPEPALYLDELRRVLRPSGRLMVCAPNDWSDETGEDPNPHHLHVYTWDRLRGELSERFLLERGFVQTAGGAMKCHHSPRAWREVPLAPLAGEAEWIVLLAMKDPCAATSRPYRETSWPLPDDPEFHVLAFARDYRNPWLVKGMVARGMRLENAAALVSVQDRILATTPSDSVDHGAALCCRAYEVLAQPRVDRDLHTTLQQAITRYAQLSDARSHQLRWQISLLFVGGELAMRSGDRELARDRFERCAALDATGYSPLLGNKTLDALFRLACMSVADKDTSTARALLVRSVAEARRLVTGSWLNVYGDPERPLPFGLAELAQLLDKASRAAYGLTMLESAQLRPAMFARQAHGWFERVLASKDDELLAARQHHHRLATELDHVVGRLGELAALLAQKEARISELGKQVRDIDAHAQQLAVAARQHEAQALARQGGRPGRLLRLAGSRIRGSNDRLRRWLRALLGRGS